MEKPLDGSRIKFDGSTRLVYKEKVQPEVVKKPPLNEPPPPEQASIYFSACIGSVFGVLITSGFFYCTTKYYKKYEKDSRGNHQRFTVNLPDDPRKEAYHPTNHVSEASESIHLIINKEIVSPEDILVDPSLDSDPTEDDSQQTPVTDSTLEETPPASPPTAKETETDCKPRSLSNSPRDTSKPGKSNNENKRVRSLSSARRQAKKEASPVRIKLSQPDATASDNCSCKSKLALETLEKEVEELRKSMNNAERMKRESMRALSSIKKEMLAMGTSIKEMGKEKDKQRELIDALKKEKKESVRVANARWRQKLMQLQETMKIELRSEFSKCELSSGSRESASGKLDSSPGKTDFTPGRGGLARDKARPASDMRSKDSRTNFRSTKIATKSSSPIPTMILPVFFEDPVGKDETECDAKCEKRQVNQNGEESKSDDNEGGGNCREDVRKDDGKEMCQDESRDGISKGNDDNKNSNSHTAVSNGVKDIKQDIVPSITDNKVHITSDREVAMITETTKIQDSDLKAEGSKVKLKRETSELEIVENCENQGGTEEISFRDKSEAELIDFDFDFGEDEIVRNDSAELDYSSVSSQTFSVSKTEMSRQENEQASDEIKEEEINSMNTSEDREKNIPELAKAEETDAASKLENVKLSAEDSDDKLKSPSSSSKETDESPKVNQDSYVADIMDNVKKCAIPRPIAQQKFQKSMFSKSYSVCKDNRKDTEDYVKSSTSAVIPARKSATAVATALLRNKPPKPNKQRRTRNDSSLVKSLLTRPSTSGCTIGDKVGSSFVTVTKNVCVLKTVGPDDQSSNNANKTSELKDGIKSDPDLNCFRTTEGETVEQNVVGEENRKPVKDIFDSGNLFWVKFDEGSKNYIPSSDKEKKATKTENKPGPTLLEEKETAKQGYAEESFDGDSISIPDTMEKNASEPNITEATDGLKKCKKISTEAERCMQNIVSLGPSFTEEDKATLEFLLDRLNPVDDFRQLASFNDTLESVVTSNNERKPSLNLPEKSNSEHVNASQKSERQVSMRSVSECANGKKEDSETTKDHVSERIHPERFPLRKDLQERQRKATEKDLNKATEKEKGRGKIRKEGFRPLEICQELGMGESSLSQVTLAMVSKHCNMQPDHSVTLSLPQVVSSSQRLEARAEKVNKLP
ncbi:hypothetical protein J437_LFUL010068 [Ladona fulva]|uniref:Uncharacterized protein n=1 Tax=Ladona fulva TaxID=123851 RepID=A0A8K0K7W2_LADFU|nr:hypothetical protein J437_LFUL010068 [Ladona fulva]